METSALPTGTTYLALAAGEARPEMALADTMGLNFPQVTLVDRDYSESTVMYLRQRFPGVQPVPSGLFTYLANTSGTDFSIVTMIGGDYILRQKDALETLLSQLPKVMSPHGVVYVETNRRESVVEIYKNYGYKPINPHLGIYTR